MRRIVDDPDFVNLKRFDYSLAAVMERWPDGAPDRIIAQALMISEDDVQTYFEGIVRELRTTMKVE